MEQTTAAKQSLMEIEARHADILKLEKSIEEMKEMFSHIALLVDQQVSIFLFSYILSIATNTIALYVHFRVT